MPHQASVASADFIRDIGYWQNEALRRPVSITHQGRERLILALPQEFQSTPANSNALADLRSEVAALRAVLQQMSATAALKLDAAGRIREADDTLCGWCGATREDLVGRRLVDLVVRGQRRDVAALVKSVMRERVVRHRQMTLRSPKGLEFVTSVGLAPMRADSQPQGAYVVLVRDVRTPALEQPAHPIPR